MAEAEAWVMIPKLDKKKTGCVLNMHPLVLCNDCKYSEQCIPPCEDRYCEMYDQRHNRNWFCADGERKNEDD